jgi:PTS system nitrogen regulatory IIA component
MQLTVRDAARILNVPERTVYRWIEEDGLPAYRVNDQFRFNRAELLEWVTSHKGPRAVTITPELFQEPPGAPTYELSAALEAGGIHHGVAGTDRETVLRAVVALLQLPQKLDTESLLQVILAREELGTTAIGDGIAIPHVRNPVVMRVERPLIMLCFLERAIDYGATDGKPVDTLFTLVTPTVRTHLHLLSRLAMSLNDPVFHALIRARAAKPDILREARRLEKTLAQAPSAGGHP